MYRTRMCWLYTPSRTELDWKEEWEFKSDQERQRWIDWRKEQEIQIRIWNIRNISGELQVSWISNLLTWEKRNWSDEQGMRGNK